MIVFPPCRQGLGRSNRNCVSCYDRLFTMRPTLAFLSLLAAAAGAQAAAYQGRLFKTEQTALWECRGDEVVWVDPPTGRWFRKGNGWYEETVDGAYACRKDIDAAGRPPAAQKPASRVPPPTYEDE